MNVLALSFGSHYPAEVDFGPMTYLFVPCEKSWFDLFCSAVGLVVVVCHAERGFVRSRTWAVVGAPFPCL